MAEVLTMWSEKT
jgi:hypothetical protein